MSMNGTMHVLYSFRAEGCPRLALGLLEAELKQTNRIGSVVTITDEFCDLEPEFRKLTPKISCLHRKQKDFVKVGFRARRLMREWKPSGIICYPLGFHVPIAAAAVSLRIPAVATIQNAPPEGPPAAVRKLQICLLAGVPFVRRYAACSDFVNVQSCRADRIPKRLVATVPNGIPLGEFFRCRQKRMSVARRRDFLHVGMVASFECHKDQSTLLAAVAHIHRRGRPVKLSLIGAGSQEKRLREETAALGIMEFVNWPGCVSDVASQLGYLDVFAYSVHGQEGLGIALVEALAAGVPVVASDVGACREVLENGRWGALVKQGDPQALADAIIETSLTPPPPPESVRRFDILDTFHAYQSLLSRANV